MRNNAIIHKTLLLLTALALSVFAQAQSPCEISCNVETPVCSGSDVQLSVESLPQYHYRWSNGRTTPTITVRPETTSTYDVLILDQDSIEVCHPSITIEVLPKFTMKYRQVKLTCSNNEQENGRDAQVIAMVDSSAAVYVPPFTYKWQVSPLQIAPGDDTWAIGLEAFKYYKIKVTDGRGCTQLDSVKLKAYPNPLVEIYPNTEEDTVVYIQNPHVDFSFENTSPDGLQISNFYWILDDVYDITSTAERPRYTYVETGNFTTELKVFNPQGCDTSYFRTIVVNPVKLKIPNVFTPNGDGVNDYFIIAPDSGNDSPSGGDTRSVAEGGYEYENYDPLNKFYQSSELTIFNRWGRIVYHSKDYQNNWDGGGLPDGTYFYVLKCHGLKQDATYQGSVAIIKSHRD